MLIALRHRETAVNFIWRCVQIFGKQGVSFLIFLLCTKSLSVYDFGIYNYSLAIVFFLMMFGDFGISTATSKYVAEYEATDRSKLQAVLFNAGIVVFLITLVITIAVLVFGPGYFHEKYTYILYLVPVVFFSPMTSLYDGVYRGLKRFKELAVISSCVGFAATAVIYFAIRQFGLVGALLSQSAFYFMLFVTLAVFYGKFEWRYDKSVMSDIAHYSVVYGLATIGNYLFVRFGVLVLGRYEYIEQISVYELISKVLAMLLLPFAILGQVIAPNFSVMAAKNDYQKIYEKSLKYTMYFSVVGVVLSVSLYVLLPHIYEYFFNEYYIRPYFMSMLALCLIAFMGNVWSATFDAGIVVPTGYAAIMTKLYLVLGAVGAISSLILVRRFGPLAVIGSVAVLTLSMVICLRLVYFLSLKKRIRELSADSKPKSL